MAHKVEFIKSDKVNKAEFKKGDIINVSKSIYDKLNANSSVKDYVEPKQTKAKKED